MFNCQALFRCFRIYVCLCIFISASVCISVSAADSLFLYFYPFLSLPPSQSVSIRPSLSLILSVSLSVHVCMSASAYKNTSIDTATCLFRRLGVWSAKEVVFKPSIIVVLTHLPTTTGWRAALSPGSVVCSGCLPVQLLTGLNFSLLCTTVSYP